MNQKFKMCLNCGLKIGEQFDLCPNCNTELVYPTEEQLNQEYKPNTSFNIEKNNNEYNIGNNNTQQIIEPALNKPEEHIPEIPIIPETPEEKKKGDRLGKISLLLWFISPIFSFMSAIAAQFTSDLSLVAIIFSNLLAMSPIAAIIVMIIGRVKYPKNKLLKIAMWIMIVLVILEIVAFVLLIAMCYATCASTDWTSCS